MNDKVCPHCRTVNPSKDHDCTKKSSTTSDEQETSDDIDDA